MALSVNSREYNEEGYGMCINCRRKKFISELVDCEICGRLVCKNCATYRRQGNPFGWICPKCKSKYIFHSNGTYTLK